MGEHPRCANKIKVRAITQNLTMLWYQICFEFIVKHILISVSVRKRNTPALCSTVVCGNNLHLSMK